MKLVIGLPWYIGPDDNTFPLYFDQMMYYGAMRERSIWRDVLGKDRFWEASNSVPPLDESGDDLGNLTEEDFERMGRLEIYICNYSRTSLVGKSREMIVDMALDVDADYLFWWDADMRFDYSAFLRMWRHNKPVVGALAFTARHPIHPVIFKITKKWDPTNQDWMYEGSDVVLDYPKDRLISSDDIGGSLAFGSGVVLYDMSIFREMPKPWFNSTGCGEDWFFCHRAEMFNIERYVDTSVKTQHKEHAPRWADEDSYWKSRETIRDSYVDIFGDSVREVNNGNIDMTKLGEAV